jgi:hypothetical protein
MRWRKRSRPGKGVGAPPRPKQVSIGSIEDNNGAEPVSLAVDLSVARTMRRLKDVAARQVEIQTRVLNSLRGTGLPTPAQIHIVIKQVSDVKADCEQLARAQNAPVLICDSDARILAFSWPNGDGSFSKLLEHNPECVYTLDDFADILKQ